MKAAAIPLSFLLELTSAVAFAQSKIDPLEQLRACSLMERSERLKCMDELSRNVSPAARVEPAVDDWIISETTSPIDYSPIVTAKSGSRGDSDSSLMQLLIRCHRGRTELVATGPTISRRGADYAISYRINGNGPVQLAGGAPSFGLGAALQGDVVRLLKSLPEQGDFAVRLSARAGDSHEGHFSLGGLKMVRDKIALACKWPSAVPMPRR